MQPEEPSADDPVDSARGRSAAAANADRSLEDEDASLEDGEAEPDLTWKRASGGILMGLSWGGGLYMLTALGTGNDDRAPMLGISEPLTITLGSIGLVGGAIGGALLASGQKRHFAIALSTSTAAIGGMLAGAIGAGYVSGSCDEADSECERDAARFFFGVFGGALLAGGAAALISSFVVSDEPEEFEAPPMTLGPGFLRVNF